MPSSCRIFEAPTRLYKACVVIPAWLNGHHNHSHMLGGMELARGILHYADTFRLVDLAGLFTDPDRAAARMNALCATYGIG